MSGSVMGEYFTPVAVLKPPRHKSHQNFTVEQWKIKGHIIVEDAH